MTVTDNGPHSAAHVTLTDDVPAGAGFVSVSAPPDWTCTVPAEGTAGTISCEKDSMANGETATFTVVATVNCDVPNGTTIGNTASASAVSPPDNDSSNDSTSASFVVFNPAPVVSASVSTAVLKQNDQNLVNVGLAAMATDGACPAPTTFTVQVFSNEDDQGPNGENHFSPDAKDIGIGTLRLAPVFSLFLDVTVRTSCHYRIGKILPNWQNIFPKASKCFFGFSILFPSSHMVAALVCWSACNVH